jgi:hypothetical protein
MVRRVSETTKPEPFRLQIIVILSGASLSVVSFFPSHNDIDYTLLWRTSVSETVNLHVAIAREIPAKGSVNEVRRDLSSIRAVASLWEGLVCRIRRISDVLSLSACGVSNNSKRLLFV